MGTWRWPWPRTLFAGAARWIFHLRWRCAPSRTPWRARVSPRRHRRPSDDRATARAGARTTDPREPALQTFPGRRRPDVGGCGSRQRICHGSGVRRRRGAGTRTSPCVLSKVIPRASRTLVLGERPVRNFFVTKSRAQDPGLRPSANVRWLPSRVATTLSNQTGLAFPRSSGKCEESKKMIYEWFGITPGIVAGPPVANSEIRPSMTPVA